MIGNTFFVMCALKVLIFDGNRYDGPTVGRLVFGQRAENILFRSPFLIKYLLSKDNHCTNGFSSAVLWDGSVCINAVNVKNWCRKSKRKISDNERLFRKIGYQIKQKMKIKCKITTYCSNIIIELKLN